MSATVKLDAGSTGRVLAYALYDCSLLVSASQRIGRVSLVPGADVESVRWFAPGHTAEVRAVCAQPNSALVASCSTREVLVWNVESGNVVLRVDRGASAIMWDCLRTHALYIAQRNSVLEVDLRAAADAPPVVRVVSPWPQPIHSVLQRAEPPHTLMAASLGGVCDGEARALVTGPVYAATMTGAALVCSYRAASGPARHVWGANAHALAEWPNAVLTRTSSFDGLFAAGDGPTVRMWSLQHAGRPALLSCTVSGGAVVTDALLFSTSQGVLWLAAASASCTQLWRVARERLALE